MSVSSFQVRQFYERLNNIFQGSTALAYRHYNERYSYAELYAYICRFNSVLADFQQKRVAVFAHKKIENYAAIFSIFLSNNTWIPFNPEIPDARNLKILSSCSPDLIFFDDYIPTSIKSYCLNNDIDCISFDDVASAEPTEINVQDFNKYQIAYIMFTSGSTGTPKGVPMTHENYINFVNNVMDVLPLNKRHVFSDFHDFSFDISIFSLFSCVLSESAFSPILEQQDKVIPIDHIVKNEITVWSSVPSVINRIKTFRPDHKIDTPIEIMFLSGEPFKLDVLKYCFDNMQLSNVYNFYGLTETGVENFYHQCEYSNIEKYKDYGMVPIGKPLPGNYVRITEDGELLLSGCQITPGYLGGSQFDKFSVIDNVRWYHSGDIVEPFEGVYFCKGRMDSQVKLSGYRVELMDIEAHISQIPDVDQVVCFVDDSRGSTLIAALKVKAAIDFSEIQHQLKKKLPAYMIPKKHFELQEFPVNVNGKTDRNEIRRIYLQGNSSV